MRLVKSVTLNQGRDTQDQINDLDLNLQRVYTALQGRLRFGTGTDGDEGENISGEFQVIADTGSADTKIDVTHSLGAVPIGFLVINIDKGGVIYDDGTPWTAGTGNDDGYIYLKCSAANAAATLFLIK